MRLFNKKTAALGVTLVAAMTLGACSSNGGGSSPKGSPKGAPPAAGNDISATPYAGVKDGGNVNWPMDSFPTNFNIYEVDGYDVATTDLMFSTLPPVWHFDAGGLPVLDKDVVDKAEQTSASPQTLQYHINPKAVWSDGTPITWQDFAGIWKADNATNKAYKINSSTGYEDIKSVTKGATDQDVTVVFKTPFTDWKSLFDQLIPASLTKNPSTFNNAWANGPTLSGGPFIVDKIDKTQKTVTVKRNPKWSGQAPKLDTIKFTVLDQAAEAAAYQSGQLDFGYTAADAATVATVKGLANTTMHQAGSPYYRHIDLSERGALADVKVRQAVMLSLDREGDAKAMLTPIGYPAKVLDSHIWMNNQAQYKSTCGDDCTQNIAKAKTLLEGAGFKLGSDGVYAKAGKPLALDFVIPAGVTTSANESQLQQTALKAAGIKVNIKTVPSDPFFPDYVQKAAYDLTIFTWQGTPFAVSSSQSIYASKGGQNFGKIGDPAIDSLYKQATAELDPAKATALSYQIDQKIWEEGHSAAMYQKPDIVATKSTLVNFGAKGFADNDYTLIGYKK